jgi:hypothetical protein
MKRLITCYNFSQSFAIYEQKRLTTQVECEELKN